MRSRAIATRVQLNPVRDAALALLAGFACLAAAFAAAPAAHGQVLSSTPYVAPPDPALEALRNRVQQLEGDLKTAVDRAEKIGFDLAQVRRTAEDAKAAQAKSDQTIADLTARLAQLEGLIQAGGLAAAGAGGQAAANGPGQKEAVTVTGQLTAAAMPDISGLPQDEDGLYKESRNLLLDSEYASAQAGLAAFLQKYPKSKNAHEAQYMLGDALLYQNKYGEAVTAYEKLLNAYPNSSNGPNALYKLARSLRLMKNNTKACQILDLMPKQYPKASAQAKEMAQTERDRANCK